MCTAITYHSGDDYFGRTLDLEVSYKETVTITPRNYELTFRKQGTIKHHYAIIGMASVMNGYPLYYEAANEWGLAMAGLNFPDNAHYFPLKEGKDNISPFELIPWVLSQCKDLKDAESFLKNMNLCRIPFHKTIPLSPLHWMIADKERAITVECVKDGLKIYENPIGVLTNNPPFEYQMLHLSDYMNLTSDIPENRFGSVDLKPYSRGMGAVGLPGDLSSASRFVRAAFVKLNSEEEEQEEKRVGQFFHILGTVEQPKGCVRLADGSLELTMYTSCINLDKGIYYYTTYDNRCISAVDMHSCNMEGTQLIQYPLCKEQIIYRQN